MRLGTPGAGAVIMKGQSYYQRQDVKQTVGGWREVPQPLCLPAHSSYASGQGQPEGTPGDAAMGVSLWGHREGREKQRMDLARVDGCREPRRANFPASHSLARGFCFPHLKTNQRTGVYWLKDDLPRSFLFFFF